MPKPKKNSRKKSAKKSEHESVDTLKLIEKFMRNKNLWETYVDKSSLLQKFFTHIAAQAAENLDSTDSDSPRDRIFDLIMLHLDELQPYKKFIKILRQDAASWPILARVLLRQAPQWLNDLNLQRSSMQRCAWISAFFGVYAYGLWLWLSDESKDRAKTMAGIDRALMRIDMILQRFSPQQN